MKTLIDKLKTTHTLEQEEYVLLIKNRTPELSDYLFQQAREIRQLHYAKDIYIRGLIEFTNYCKNDCFYCGIRRGNENANRFRLTKETILTCCEEGYKLGFRTFVLQGGEDPYFSDDRVVDIITSIKERHPDCALTLSIGEKSRESYNAYKEAGADRYLLRHETANEGHYKRLHPSTLSLANRKECLWNLKELGYQVGAGFMVGSPYQTEDHLAEDLLFLKELQPDMVGIGPFIPHCDTPYGSKTPGSLDLTLFMLGLVRLTLPTALLPATTALGTIAENGRELGILAGANVIMPNLSPDLAKDNYTLYNNKLHTGAEAASGLSELTKQMESIGYRIVVSRGDAKHKGGHSNV